MICKHKPLEHNLPSCLEYTALEESCHTLFIKLLKIVCEQTSLSRPKRRELLEWVGELVIMNRSQTPGAFVMYHICISCCPLNQGSVQLRAALMTTGCSQNTGVLLKATSNWVVRSCWAMCPKRKEFVVNICTPLTAADWTEVSGQIFTLYMTWIFSGAVRLCNFPDVRGSLSRRPFGYCSVCMPFVIWVVHWLHTDSDAGFTQTLMLCVQQQNIAHSPPDSFGMGWYTDGEACWLTISVNAPSVMPERKFKIIWRAPTSVRAQDRGMEVWCVLHPQFICNVKK